MLSACQSSFISNLFRIWSYPVPYSGSDKKFQIRPDPDPQPVMVIKSVYFLSVDFLGKRSFWDLKTNDLLH
jgi:hypothetical protein